MMIEFWIIVGISLLFFYLRLESKEEIARLNDDIKRISSLREEDQVRYEREIKECQNKILIYENEINRLNALHQEEISRLNERLQNSSNLRIQKSEFSDFIALYAWKEIYDLRYSDYSLFEFSRSLMHCENNRDKIIEQIKIRFSDAIEEQYKYRYLIYLYPELCNIFNGTEIVYPNFTLPSSVSQRSENLYAVINLLKKDPERTDELIIWRNRIDFLEATRSNLTIIPYMAKIMADYETYGLEHLAKELDWGHNVKRLDKVKAIREIRKDARMIVEKNKESQYQLDYLLKLFPSLQDVIETDYNELPPIQVSEISEYDSARDYLTKEEYQSLSNCERNQLALDRYKNSHKRTKWQIGRDYEMFVGYTYAKKGYNIDYFGSYKGLEDLGRDIIAQKGNQVLIIQCKYWSAKKLIHENHINQLFGTITCYSIERNLSKENVRGILITNIQLSPMAKKMASFLGIEYIENYEMSDYPCIKCNIGHDEYGYQTKIYHLPFDQQYDSTKIKQKGEFFAMTVAEAEKAGFRRAFKWFGAK